MKKTSAAELAADIMAMLEDFKGACTEDIKEAQKTAGKEAVKKIKEKAPGKGEYAKTWKSSTTEKSGAVKTVIYAGKVGRVTGYALAHLLEFGHAKVNGGRTRAFEHIAPAEEYAMKVYEDELRRRIENGT